MARASTASGLRNVAYALTSGADGWMFDGEDALGQVDTMSLDNFRNIKLAFAGDPQFHEVAEVVAGEMNNWGVDFHGREIIADWHEQLEVTTRIFRARGLHLDDRHIAHQDGRGYSASMADAALYLTNNAGTLRGQDARSFSTCRRSRRPPRPHTGPPSSIRSKTTFASTEAPSSSTSSSNSSKRAIN